MADCCGPAMTVLTLTVHSSTLGGARIMFNTPICWKTPGEQHGTREILSCRYVSNSKKTLQNAPLERPASFAFPERISSWHKYNQSSGYHYFTNDPALMYMLCVQCIRTVTIHTIGNHTTFIIDWYESIY